MHSEVSANAETPPQASPVNENGIGRAWYSSSIGELRKLPSASVLGTIAKNTDFNLVLAQRDAWIKQIDILSESLGGLEGQVFLEFTIPRLGRRIDVVLIVGAVVFVLEFKVGETSYALADTDQVWDYALDLKNFHKASHLVPIVPVLIATNAPPNGKILLEADPDNVYRPVGANAGQLRMVIDDALSKIPGPPIDASAWYAAVYHPTPTIVEAARALYAQHLVEAIARFDAGTRNLRITASRIEELVEQARQTGQKIICFVTGVPGAGKTLVGLNVATKNRDQDEPTHAVFLSGNGPLVAVLREALTRDEVARRKAEGEKVKKGRVAEGIKAFIQNVHHFRDDALIETGAPIEHVVIFDEAQRAWNLQQTANFMARKKGKHGFSQSEPQFLISCMDRHSDWAVVVCLVGGGQEINIGEAGIDAWLQAAMEAFPHWQMYISSNLTDSEYSAGRAMEQVQSLPNVHLDDSLHLSVSMRSFRAENVSMFVKALLDCEKKRAREALDNFISRFPIAVTRNLELAKKWLREHARGTERFGIVASSKALRLKPHAIDIRVNVDPVHWFLNDKEDTRASYYLEDAATEFQVQGLELDWTCVTWDGDLRFSESGWTFHDFRGSKWCNISNLANREYLRNAYRVLLTRARQGMVIFVPEGNELDPTRAAAFYDSTFKYLTEVGVPILS